jgi:membrane-associated phospholipid phosphatase
MSAVSQVPSRVDRELQPASLEDAAPAEFQVVSSSSRSAGLFAKISADENASLLPLGTDPQNRLGLPLIKHLASDQQQFWTIPRSLTRRDVKTFAPFAAFTGLLIAGDSWIARPAPDQASSWKRSQKVSDYALVSLLGAGGGAYLWGHFTHNDHLRETGLLSGEAALNGTAVVYTLKSITQRPRPQEGRGNGNFFQGGDSFPSEHAALAWSVATVFAHEYPGPMTKFLAYGLASAVTLTRVTGQQHFASDALVGSVLGWYFGRQAYRAHHDPELGGATWGTFEETREEASPRPENMGSPYVPLDSWIYPAFDRLVALGYVDSVISGIRPWTRMECARLLEEAGERISPHGDGADLPLYDSLTAELKSETEALEGGRNLSLGVDSIYTRFTGISGTPLADGYHFGQTIINDYGRPYTQGLNLISGFEAHASAGPFTLYVRGEYQHTPTIDPLSESERDLIAAIDDNPILPAVPVHEVNQFRLLDTYVAWNWKNTQISAGKQSLWWGPGSAGPLLFSNDAEPVYMLRINRVTPLTLPGWFKGLGPMSTDFFFGKLSGHRFPNGPFIHGSKISFKPTPNLELGFSRTVVFAGQGRPLTWASFWRSFISGGDNPNSGRPDAGDRRTGFDFSYRLPKLRRWLTLYNDSMADDDPLPLLAPQHSAMNPGLYLSHFPGVPKLDFRAEAVYTDVFTAGSIHGTYVYWNSMYHDSYTNQGNLLGNWIGREGRGYQTWSTYWFSPRSRLQLGYRAASVSSDFLPGGGGLNDYRLRGETPVHDFVLSGSLQYETWQVPALVPGRQANFTATFQIEFRPHLKLR